MKVPLTTAAAKPVPGGAPVTAPSMSVTETSNLVTKMLDDERARGAAFADKWLADNSKKKPSLAAFAKAAVASIGPPPATNEADMKITKAATATRAPADIKAAEVLNEHGYNKIWWGIFDQWKANVPTADAKRGAALLKGALDTSYDVSVDIKSTYARNRPFVDDPKLPIVGGGVKVDPHKSYPSGHASSSFAAAVVMGALMPKRAEEFTKIAQDVSYARVFSSMHYASDVATGAYIGGLTGRYMLSTNPVK